MFATKLIIFFVHVSLTSFTFTNMSITRIILKFKSNSFRGKLRKRSEMIFLLLA